MRSSSRAISTHRFPNAGALMGSMMSETHSEPPFVHGPRCRRILISQTCPPANSCACTVNANDLMPSRSEESGARCLSSRTMARQSTSWNGVPGGIVGPACVGVPPPGGGEGGGGFPGGAFPGFCRRRGGSSSTTASSYQSSSSYNIPASVGAVVTVSDRRVRFGSCAIMETR